MLWNKELRVIDQEATHTSASVQLAFSFNGSESGYPFLLTVKIRYLLSVDGFFVTVEAKNDDPGWPLPFFNGWHPYFLATLHTATLTLDPCSTGWNHVDVDTGPQFPPPRYSNMVRRRCSRSSWALEDSAGGGAAHVLPAAKPSSLSTVPVTTVNVHCKNTNHLSRHLNFILTFATLLTRPY